MTNPHFAGIDQYRDVETRNAYRRMLIDGQSDSEAMQAIDQKSRDNSRTPMQWSGRPHAGFSVRRPWIDVCRNYPEVNVEAAMADEDSVLHHYRRLIRLRKEMPLITHGAYRDLLPLHPQIWSYTRCDGKDALLVVNNLGRDDADFLLPAGHLEETMQAQLILANYADRVGESDFRRIALRPFESLVFYVSGNAEEAAR
jgi:trehalose-6-phosphate hydrolase